jgi:PAS domain-containing protein
MRTESAVATGVPKEPGRLNPRTITDWAGRSADPVALDAAAALGLPAWAGMLVGTDDGLFVVDERGRFTYANPAACRGKRSDQSDGADLRWRP